MPDQVVELKPRPRDKVSIRLSGGRFFTIPEEGARELRVDMVLSDEEIERLDKMDQYFRGKEKAMRLLSLRSRTRAEIKTALASITLDPSIRNGLVHELEDAGLIDDRRFAIEYVRVKSEVKRMGPHRLRHDLKRLGVVVEIVDDVLAASFDTESQEAMARELVSKKIGDGPVGEKEVRRVADFLRRKGYDYEVINRISYELLRRSDDGEE
jgi:regulatory protein